MLRHSFVRQSVNKRPPGQGSRFRACLVFQPRGGAAISLPHSCACPSAAELVAKLGKKAEYAVFILLLVCY